MQWQLPMSYPPAPIILNATNPLRNTLGLHIGSRFLKVRKKRRLNEIS